MLRGLLLELALELVELFNYHLAHAAPRFGGVPGGGDAFGHAYESITAGDHYAHFTQWRQMPHTSKSTPPRPPSRHPITQVHTTKPAHLPSTLHPSEHIITLHPHSCLPLGHASQAHDGGPSVGAVEGGVHLVQAVQESPHLGHPQSVAHPDGVVAGVAGHEVALVVGVGRVGGRVLPLPISI